MSTPPRRLCVFCGSNPGKRPVYVETAQALGRELVARGYGLVFGGGRVGLMGAVADAVLEAGGEVLGVIPEGLKRREVAHEGLTELLVVDSMHTRKHLMAEHSQGFIALPGGLGTFEEMFEVVTWAQLGIHGKPCGLLDVDGYFEPVLAQLDRGVEEGFVRAAHRDLWLRETTPAALLDRMEAHVPAKVQKWMDEAGT